MCLKSLHPPKFWSSSAPGASVQCMEKWDGSALGGTPSEQQGLQGCAALSLYRAREEEEQPAGEEMSVELEMVDHEWP